MGDTLRAEGLAVDVGIRIFKPSFDIQEERRDFAARALESADCVD